jgi:hypothetical protein
MQHLQVASSCCTGTGLLFSEAAIGACPLEHLQVASCCRTRTGPRVPGAAVGRATAPPDDLSQVRLSQVRGSVSHCSTYVPLQVLLLGTGWERECTKTGPYPIARGAGWYQSLSTFHFVCLTEQDKATDRQRCFVRIVESNYLLPHSSVVGVARVCKGPPATNARNPFLARSSILVPPPRTAEVQHVP